MLMIDVKKICLVWNSVHRIKPDIYGDLMNAKLRNLLQYNYIIWFCTFTKFIHVNYSEPMR